MKNIQPGQERIVEIMSRAVELSKATMPTPSQLPERLEVDKDGNIEAEGYDLFAILPFTPTPLTREICHRYNTYPTLLQELEELRKALRRVMEIDGPGLDLSPCGSCYDVAKQALSMTQK